MRLSGRAGSVKVWHARSGLADMRALHAVLFCLLAAGGSHAQTLSGHWCGVGEQANPDGSKSFWSASLLLRGAEGHMHYPSLDCGGTLTFERTDDQVHS